MYLAHRIQQPIPKLRIPILTNILDKSLLLFCKAVFFVKTNQNLLITSGFAVSKFTKSFLFPEFLTNCTSNCNFTIYFSKCLRMKAFKKGNGNLSLIKWSCLFLNLAEGHVGCGVSNPKNDISNNLWYKIHWNLKLVAKS